MRALELIELGDPTISPGREGSPFRIVEDAEPPMEPPPGMIVLRVAAGAINFADLLVIGGTYQEKPPLPYVPGSECSGTVVAVGEDVEHLAVGDKVTAVASFGGGFSEQALVMADAAVKLPASLSEERLEQAAGLLVAAGTAWLAVHERGQLRAGETLLVLGAAGGVGVFTVQLGKLAGARVVAVARGADKCALLKKLGADAVIDSSTLGPGGLRQAISEAAPQRIDVIFDPVGGQACQDALRCVNLAARLLVIGFAAGVPKVPLNVALVKNLTIHGVYWGQYATFRPAVYQESLREVARLYGEGKLVVPVSHVFRLEEIGQGMAAIKERKVVGKAIVLPGKGAKI